ncbi:adhesion G protein-coupled receptor E3-like [Engraulis encrasicolus]|uniref:adhesion G protein-coupled receptor E3-like n=1 Tax=Engraulis encrasicolus TaxID=184585 RepID=UPI002FD1F0B0
MQAGLRLGTGTGTSSVLYVDECKEYSTRGCGPVGICTNLPGGFYCDCVAGFKKSKLPQYKDDTGYCEDVDECVESPPDCGPFGTCQNTFGGFSCCPPGFSNHGNITRPCTVSSLLGNLLDSPPDSLACKGDAVLQSTEDLVSTLAKPTATISTVEILSIGPSTSLTGVSQLMTSIVSVDIDLLGIAHNNYGSVSVVVIVYSKMHEILNASFFKIQHSRATVAMLSNVISITLPNAHNKMLPQSVNISMQHLKSVGLQDKRWCVYWKVSSWIQDGCYVSATNSSHTICSCDHLSTFALIMSVDDNLESDPVMSILNTVLVLIGLLFLTLAVMTFALCRWNPRVSNVARLNLCVCLLLAHTLFLLTQSFLRRIKVHQALCKTLAGVLHYLFLSSFVWMFIEAVMLLLSVRKLRQVKPSERAWLQWKVSLPIGYGIPLVIVGVSAGVNPEGYGSEKCWLVEGFTWSFLGPVCFLLVVNTILFLTIIAIIQSTLKEARSDVSKVKYTRVLLFKLTVQFLILGCPWLLGMGASTSRVLEVLFLFLTSQQGTAIFLIHCLLNTEVRCQYRKWWQRFSPSSKQPESGTGTGTGPGTGSISLTQQPSRDT